MFNTVLQSCALAGEADKADEWFQNMKQRGLAPDIVTLGNLANANAKQGRFIRAEECLRELKTLRLSPNIIVLNSVINACSQAGDRKSVV